MTFGGTDWRDGPDVAAQMFAAFPIMRRLHELLWYLRSQLDVAVGDGATKIDDTLRRPAHWSATQDGGESGPQPGRSESRPRWPAPRTDRAARHGPG